MNDIVALSPAEPVIPIDKVVRLFRDLRSEKDRINAEAKTAVAAIDEKLDKLEAYILARMKVDNVTSYNTEEGTAYQSKTSHANVTDMAALIEYVKRNDAFDLFEKRVSKTAVKALVDAEKPVPDGVNYSTRVDVNFRKPSKKD